MRIGGLLGVAPGVTPVIGSGGKTTLLRTLAGELPGRVILCTTTHILPFKGVSLYTGTSARELEGLLGERRVVCVGSPGGDGKLTAPALSMEALARLAEWVLVEADGSRGLPLKAHAPHEPVIPPGSRPAVCVVGASGFGRLIREAVHRPEIFCLLAGAEPDAPVSPALAARALTAEGLARRVLLNQVETAEDWARAEDFARAWGTEPGSTRVLAGSLKQGEYRLLAGSLKQGEYRLLAVGPDPRGERE